MFDNTVKPIVDAAVNGFNGTVFTYGQTNTGKTYTMMGTPEEPGMISLAIKYMFDVIANTPRREFLLRFILCFFFFLFAIFLSKVGCSFKFFSYSYSEMVEH